MDAIQECMKMTSFGGEAKSLAIQAIRLARKGAFQESEQTMQKAQEALVKGHQAHMELLSYDANTGDLRVTIFMVHAADHLNAAETVYDLAEEMILLYKEGKHV